ncbi:MAG: bifunctional 2-C-methyl-D-erythritol 4-phosphate cytidylyltransferase/2-C-methyl-D-erythritol 2,4-cyclodiphosphate synthase [Pseudomonadota bacterium]
MVIHAVIVAGGKGSRAASDTPKQFTRLGSKPVYQWSLDIFTSHPAVQSVVLVVPEEYVATYRPDHNDSDIEVVSGGIDRTASVKAGLAALHANADDFVMIHDAARPGLSAKIISGLAEALEDADASAPALPVADALKHYDGQTMRSMSRDNLYRVQTPQAFRYGLIKTLLHERSGALVDDLSALEANGGKTKLIEGDERLSKVTWPSDFDRMERLLTLSNLSPRVGTGFDVHAFGSGEFVTLCGLEIPHSKGLIGHSDADVAWHALTDAILGALAMGDIGDHFPPSDDQWKGAASSVFLKHACELAGDEGYRIANCDITIICEKPKIGPHRQAMCEATAALLDIPVSFIGVKATTTEQLGFTGRGEGIAAQAACMLVPK